MKTIGYLVLSVLAMSGSVISAARATSVSSVMSSVSSVISVTGAPFSPSPAGRSPAPATANTALPTNLAQLEGQCRLVNRPMGIYEEPRTSSRSFGIVAEGQIVILGDGSENSWARIVSPRIGWVDARNLRVIDCISPSVPEISPEDPVPTPSVRPSDRCTVVIYDGQEGLGIYSRPSSSSPSLGSLPARSRVYLTGNTSTEPAGRQWVEIISNDGDDYGWIPETGTTGPNSGYNIRTLACSNIVGEIVTR